VPTAAQRRSLIGTGTLTRDRSVTSRGLPRRTTAAPA
jgi:hypothetical protein